MQDDNLYQYFPSLPRVNIIPNDKLDTLCNLLSEKISFNNDMINYPNKVQYWQIYKDNAVLEQTQYSDIKKEINNWNLQDELKNILLSHTWVLISCYQFATVLTIARQTITNATKEQIIGEMKLNIKYVNFILNIFIQIIIANSNSETKNNFEKENFATGFSMTNFKEYSSFIIDVCNVERKMINNELFSELFTLICNQNLLKCYDEEDNEPYSTCNSSTITYYLIGYNFHSDEPASLDGSQSDKQIRSTNYVEVYYNVVESFITSYLGYNFSPIYLFTIVDHLANDVGDGARAGYTVMIPRMLEHYDGIFNKDQRKRIFKQNDTTKKYPLEKLFNFNELKSRVDKTVRFYLDSNSVRNMRKSEDYISRERRERSSSRERSRMDRLQANRERLDKIAVQKENEKLLKEINDLKNQINKLNSELTIEKTNLSNLKTDYDNGKVSEQTVADYFASKNQIATMIGNKLNNVPALYIIGSNNKEILLPIEQIPQEIPLSKIIEINFSHYLTKLNTIEDMLTTICDQILVSSPSNNYTGNNLSLGQKVKAALSELINIKELIDNQNKMNATYTTAINEMYRLTRQYSNNRTQDENITAALKDIESKINYYYETSDLTSTVDGIIKTFSNIFNTSTNTTYKEKLSLIIQRLADDLITYMDSSINTIIRQEAEKENKSMQEKDKEKRLNDMTFTSLIQSIDSSSAETYVKTVLDNNTGVQKLEKITGLFNKLSEAYNKKINNYRQEIYDLKNEYIELINDLKTEKETLESEYNAKNEELDILSGEGLAAVRQLEVDRDENESTAKILKNKYESEIVTAKNTIKEMLSNKNAIFNSLFDKTLNIKDFQSLLQAYTFIEEAEKTVKQVKMSDFEREIFNFISMLAKVKIEAVISDNSDENDENGIILDMYLERIYKPIRALHDATLITTESKEQAISLTKIEDSLEDLLKYHTPEHNRMLYLQKIFQSLNILTMNIRKYIEARGVILKINKINTDLEKNIGKMKEEYNLMKKTFVRVVTELVSEYYNVAGYYPNLMNTVVFKVLEGDDIYKEHPLVTTWFMNVSNNFDTLIYQNKKDPDSLFNYAEEQTKERSKLINFNVERKYQELIEEVKKLSSIIENDSIIKQTEEYEKNNETVKSSLEILKEERGKTEILENNLITDLKKWYQIFIDPKSKKEDWEEKSKILWERLEGVLKISHSFYNKLIIIYDHEYTTLKSVQKDLFNEDYKIQADKEIDKLFNEIKEDFDTINLYRCTINDYAKYLEIVRVMCKKAYNIKVLTSLYNIDKEFILQPKYLYEILKPEPFVKNNADELYTLFLDIQDLLELQIEVNSLLEYNKYNKPLKEITRGLIYKLTIAENDIPLNIYPNENIDVTQYNKGDTTNKTKIQILQKAIELEEAQQILSTYYKEFLEYFDEFIKISNNTTYNLETLQKLEDCLMKSEVALNQIAKKYSEFCKITNKDNADIIPYTLMELNNFKGFTIYTVTSITAARNIIQTIIKSLEYMKDIEKYYAIKDYDSAIKTVNKLSNELTQNTLLGITVWKFTFMPDAIAMNSNIITNVAEKIKIDKEEAEKEEENRILLKLNKTREEINKTNEENTKLNTKNKELNESIEKFKKEIVDKEKSIKELNALQIQHQNNGDNEKAKEMENKMTELIKEKKSREEMIFTLQNEKYNLEQTIKSNTHKNLDVTNYIIKEISGTTVQITEELMNLIESNTEQIKKLKELQSKDDELKDNTNDEITKLQTEIDAKIKEIINKKIQENKIETMTEKSELEKNLKKVNTTTIEYETIVGKWSLSLDKVLENTKTSQDSKHEINQKNIYDYLKLGYLQFDRLLLILKKEGSHVNGDVLGFTHAHEIDEFFKDYRILLKYIELSKTTTGYNSERISLAEQIVLASNKAIYKSDPIKIITEYCTANGFEANTKRELIDKIKLDVKEIGRILFELGISKEEILNDMKELCATNTINTLMDKLNKIKNKKWVKTNYELKKILLNVNIINPSGINFKANYLEEVVNGINQLFEFADNLYSLRIRIGNNNITKETIKLFKKVLKLQERMENLYLPRINVKNLMYYHNNITKQSMHLDEETRQQIKISMMNKEMDEIIKSNNIKALEDIEGEDSSEEEILISKDIPNDVDILFNDYSNIEVTIPRLNKKFKAKLITIPIPIITEDYSEDYAIDE